MSNIVTYPRANKWLSQAWSLQETACIERVFDRLMDAGVISEIVQGQTERGDPWAVGLSDDHEDYVISFSKVGSTFAVHTHGGNKLIFSGCCDGFCDGVFAHVGTVVLAS